MSIKSSYPTDSPSLVLDFANSRRLDPRITFTRAQTGNISSYMGPDGLIKYAGPDQPRFDHRYNSVTGEVESLGLLIEESRVNAFDDFTDQGKFPNTDKSLKELYDEMYNGSYNKDLEIYNDALEMWGRQIERMTLVPELTTQL